MSTDMNTKQITDALHKIYSEERLRIVFWNDPDREFEDTLDTLPLDGVKIVRMDQCGPIALKIRLEVDEPQQRFLLYSPAEEPEFDDDPLLDIRLYGRKFRADRSSMLLDELGLAGANNIEHLKRRSKFFANKDRISKLKPFIKPDDNELEIDGKIIAVLTESESIDFPSVTRTLFSSYMEQDEIDLDSPPPAWSQIEKYELEESFWKLASMEFVYRNAEPTPQKFLFSLFFSDFAHQLAGAAPVKIAEMRLPPAGTHNAVNFLSTWRDSNRLAEAYNAIAESIENKFSIESTIDGLEPEKLRGVLTFPCAGRVILKGLWERLQASRKHIDAAPFREIATQRQNGHWCDSRSVQESRRQTRRASYETLALAAEFFELCGSVGTTFDVNSAEEMFTLYTEKLYRFDQLYRQFHYHASQTQADLFKTLQNDIEDAYRQAYLVPLSLKWARIMESGLLERWKIDGVDNQYDFYDKYVAPRLEEAEKRKAYVIISDAFRYEAAEELLGVLNGKYRCEAEISSMLGVLPSYTALGMASLLPHDKLAYNEKGDVLVDGRSSAGLDNRIIALEKVQGTAFKADKFLNMKKEERRQATEDKKVVYIYQDIVDSTGDDAKTEENTFEAANHAIDELAEIINRIINDLSGSYILVTADHGFLFTKADLGETDRCKLAERPPGAIIAKKRYLLGKNFSNHTDVWRGETPVSAHCDGDMEFCVPKGTSRFHFVGGARFIHGGAMPQEIIVPVLTVRQTKDKAKARTQISAVDVTVLGNMPIRISTSVYPFRFFQTDPVGDRIKPLTVKIAIYDDAEPISNMETVTFDSTSTELAQREKTVKLTLRSKDYDKKKKYKLSLRDVASDYEVTQFDVQISLAIFDDFGF